MAPPALSSKIKGLKFMQRAAETIKRQQETSNPTQGREGHASKDGASQERRRADSWAEEASKKTCIILRNAGQGASSYGKMTFGSKKTDPIDIVDEQVKAVEKDLKRMAEDDPPKSAATQSGNKKKKRRR